MITNSSATLEIDGVKEIGRKCLLTSVAGFTYGTGMMSACFHIDGNLCSSKEELIILQTGFASISAYVLHNQFGIPSGPLAFRGLILLSRLHVSSSVNSKSLDLDQTRHSVAEWIARQRFIFTHFNFKQHVF